MEWSRVRRRCPRTKRVPGRNEFALKCHAQTVRERGREREKQTEKLQSTVIPKREKIMVCMHEKCMIM